MTVGQDNQTPQDAPDSWPDAPGRTSDGTGPSPQPSPAEDLAARRRANLSEGFRSRIWQPGQSGNPEGRRSTGRRSSISRRVRDLLAEDSDMLDAARIVEAFEGKEAFQGYEDLPRLTNADLLARAVIGIALNRSGTVTVEMQLKAQALIWAYMDGKPVDGISQRQLAKAEDEGRPLLSIEDFRAAVAVVNESEAPSQPDQPPVQPQPDLVVATPEDVVVLYDGSRLPNGGRLNDDGDQDDA